MTKLCPRGKAAAKRKFKVYPSAYANAYASKVCAGKIKDDRGVKRKDFKGSKPSGSKVASAARKVKTAKIGGTMKVRKAGLGAIMLLNEVRKQGKKEGRRQAAEGQSQDKQYQEFLAMKEKDNMTTANEGKFVTEIPIQPGNAIELSIDGDDSFVNPSAQAYYKDIL